MRKSIQQTIKDCALALKVGVAEYWVRNCLIADGWPIKKADQILAWSRVYVERTKGQSSQYPDTTVINVSSKKFPTHID